MKKLFLILFVSGVFCMPKLLAQALINAVPIENNPSFAGSAGTGRVTSAFSAYNYKKNDPIGFTGNCLSEVLAFDQFISKIRTGIGVSLGYSNLRLKYRFPPNIPEYLRPSEEALKLKMQALSLGLAIAPKFSIKGLYTFSPSIGATWIEGRRELLLLSKEIFGYLNLNMGLLVNTRNFYMGYTLNLLTKSIPDYPYIEAAGLTYRRWKTDRELMTYRSSFQMGYTFQKREDSKFSFSPLVIFYMNPYKFRSAEFITNLTVNLSLKYKRILTGLTSSNIQQGIIAGYQHKNIKMMVAYYPIPSRQSAGQISFRYLIPSKKTFGLPTNNY